MSKTVIKLPAVEVKQGPDRLLYTFAVDGKVVPAFATVSRLKRDDDGLLAGYQRPEVLSHIGAIRDYVESDAPMIPNAVVIAFDSRVRFEPDRSEQVSSYARTGILVIPVDDQERDEAKPGFIVDGQQRLAAIRDAQVDTFPVCVTAFITNDVRKQTEQFLLVNSTKPLPKGLIYELLPHTDAPLPALLRQRRLPASLLERLNRDAESPMKGLIQTPTTPEGVIKDNSVLRMIENSLDDGVLFRFRGALDQKDYDEVLPLLYSFWGAVKTVFKDAWGVSPKKSRLMHGAGIVSLGFLMDAIAERYREKGIPTETDFATDLDPLRGVCRWTDGYWHFGPGCQRKWNEIQNTSKDIQLLSNFLLIAYKGKVWNSTPDARA